MRTVKLAILVVFGASLALSLGCNGRTAVSNHYGEAYRENVARMTENPLAGQATVSIEGLDPQTADEVMDKYHELQRKVPSEKEKSQSIIDIKF